MKSFYDDVIIHYTLHKNVNKNVENHILVLPWASAFSQIGLELVLELGIKLLGLELI